MKRCIPVFMFLALLGLTYAYLYPGSEALFQQRTDTAMSDDTDPASLPFVYDALVRTWHDHPSRFFYGTVFVDGTNPEHGTAVWMPWNERWTVLAASNFFVIEQLSTAVVFVLLVLNALAMFALSRYLNWSRSVSAGLAIAWAFCAFTRARAKVHMSMAGTYHLPLIFLGLFLVTRGKGKRSLAVAALTFLLACTVVHYFLVTTIFLAPLFLLFLALQPETKANWRRIAGRTALAILPAVVFLGFNFLVPLPADVNISREQSFPTGGEVEAGTTHPFLYYFAARPIDYLGGDISLHESPKDSNPLREEINKYILSHLDGGNSHERSNGIRWLILVLGFAAIVALVRGKFRTDPRTQANVLFFTIFALLTFWLSQSPDFPLPKWGLSYWLHELVSQVRVPSRAAINVHFAMLMLSGFLLSSQIRWRRWLQYPFVLPLLMVLGYPPLTQEMPMAPIRPVYAELQRQNGTCGAGFYFPFINFYAFTEMNYRFMQQLRGSDCTVLNALSTPRRLNYMIEKFPPQQEYLNQLPSDAKTAQNIEKLVRCVPLTWMIFDPSTPQAWRESMCQRLGWKMHPDLVCTAPNLATPMQRLPDECG